MMHLLTSAAVSECRAYKCQVLSGSKVIGQAARGGAGVTRQFATVTDSSDILCSMLLS